ncbi:MULTISPECIES: DUF2290 domain-containing protein [Xanthomonas]|uniref:DUF2290 domain-containing protein n=2 Tax=Xanthomonas TaxID=338 RepID=A0A7Z7NIQ5_XANCH|nr:MULTISPECIES: DUF2290 domain-containing protein [Xanthomonas]ATS37578.1 DUF2290 domain-containing protein [Xanthomonas citri pv. phaseoli var. fuscans]ATS43610.1 DUF2290 domain-containing protein [Xanthomonas citri pv. phaseoli var. fuscans]ATS45580.1 DUF2290 domain-containing protein [Xanthomonas citri pv. phaseoli var. fuscans]ATS84153.1 DUF2290 domain-containing protein [Xanthomonas citri pv. phaseoli var. fuscans]QWN19250.1 DUF2290 domain-containing protein [Xanthomonas citri]
MTSIAAVQQGMQHVRSVLRPILQVDRAIVGSSGVITWANRQRGIDRDIYYALEYQYLIDNAQYSFLLQDGSFVQMYYEFSALGLLKARLAYYPPPLRVNARAVDFLSAAESFYETQDGEKIGDHLFNWYEAIEENRDLPLNTSHLRFDFDRGVTSHAPSHIQYGALQDLRLAADCFPMPASFIEILSPMLGLDLDVSSVEVNHARNNIFRFDGGLPLISIRARE